MPSRVCTNRARPLQMPNPPLEIASGIRLWHGALDQRTQKTLLAEVFQRAASAPFYRPRMPISGKPFSVEETNFGPLGWVSDETGYRYGRVHPISGEPWPQIPPLLLHLWRQMTRYPALPECC